MIRRIEFTSSTLYPIPLLKAANKDAAEQAD